MKALKLKLYQETACYKKPFAFKVTETYPLPPYSTVIGMIHKIIGAKSGEYVDMNISVQGEYESIFNTYNTTMFYKSNNVTTMPLNVHMLLGVNLIIHIQAEENVLDRIINGFKETSDVFTLGRGEDLVRLDCIKKVDLEELKVNRYNNKSFALKNNCYIPKNFNYGFNGISYKLNKKYEVKNDLRTWEKVQCIFVEKGQASPFGTYLIDNDSNGKDIVFLG